MRAVTLWITLVGCSGGKGKDEDTAGSDASCDDIGTAPLGTVPSTEWPAGLAEAVPVYNGLGGRWTATSSCSEEPVALKFTPKSQEALLVVTEPLVNPALACGCLTDPQFPDDTAFDAVALHEDFGFFVEEFADPALDAKTFSASGALFGPNDAMTFRACATDDVDPILQSAYDQVTTILRVVDGVKTGTLVLKPLTGAAQTCELSEFTLVEGL